MATEDYVKRVISTIGSDPGLMDELLEANNENQRKKILEGRGLIKKGDHGPSKEDVKKHIEELVTPTQESAAGEERPVEWVSAIGTAAAGVAAAFCAAE
jgi:hypothetical protein